MIPVPYATYASTVFYVSSNGNVSYGGADRVRAIRPTLYLKGDVKIVERSYEDYGSIDHPFELSYE